MFEIPSSGLENHASLKRRIALLEEENAELVSKMIKTPVHSYIREGRAIRRLVSLTEPVTDLIAEYDRRAMLAEDEDGIEAVPSSDTEKRTFRSYKKLVQWCPSVKTLMKVPNQAYQLTATCQELKKGADGARGDDANTLKTLVATWLNEQDPHPVPLFIIGEKRGRGFNHDVMGKLLCPVDYDWFDPSIRDAIRDYHPHYAVTANMWPTFLYRKGLYNAERPLDGLFKGELLVKTFRCIFTSPSSTREDSEFDTENIDDQPRTRKTQKTARDIRTHRCNVAGLLRMRSVEPRTIAYAAAQLRFALSSATTWNLQDDNFDYEVFYNNIVDWFEQPSQVRAREIEMILLWWNRSVFGRHHTSTLQPQETEKLSVSISMVISFMLMTYDHPKQLEEAHDAG
ncbi:hypothetical protein V8E55_012140 [Tylopilus felleus]